MRGWKIALFASLALNLLVIGAVATIWIGNSGYSGKGGGDRSAHSSDRRGGGMRQAGPIMLWPVLELMDRDERRAFGKTIQDKLKQQGLTRADVRPVVLSLADAIEADPVDQSALKDALDQMKTHAETRNLVLEGALVERVLGFSADQRKNIAAKLRSHRRSGKKK